MLCFGHIQEGLLRITQTLQYKLSAGVLAVLVYLLLDFSSLEAFTSLPIAKSKVFPSFVLFLFPQPLP